MTKVLIFGATGNLGKEIAKELIAQGYEVTAVVRSEAKAKSMSKITQVCVVADPLQPVTLKNIFKNQEIVVSAFGKSVSPYDRSKPSFREVDFTGNLNILNQAKTNDIRKFLYVSAFYAENYPHLEYFAVHHEFSEALKNSGIDYAIVKPPAIYSAFLDMIDMARKGQLVNMGAGDKKTNPIYEGDLAIVCAEAIKQTNAVVAAGGKEVYTRRQINEIIQQVVAPNKKVRTVPMGLVKFFLPFIKRIDRNLYDKLTFYLEVMQHDVIAPQIGELTLEEYIRRKVSSE
jgi:uncharacterized protein YbjT (DUF2867 family)